MNFKKGDGVVLKSGGPKIVVEDIAQELEVQPLITCRWFDSKNVIRCASFPPETLELSE
jgi:uncharacterized protein YodC (DUF2158 family)